MSQMERIFNNVNIDLSVAFVLSTLTKISDLETMAETQASSINTLKNTVDIQAEMIANFMEVRKSLLEIFPATVSECFSGYFRGYL